MSTSNNVGGTLGGDVSGNMLPTAMDVDYSMLTGNDLDSETFLSWFDNLEWETMPLQV